MARLPSLHRFVLGLLLSAGGVFAQPVDPSGGERHQSPYFGNPFESAERPEREASLRDAESQDGSQFWSDNFAPRLFYDIFDTELPGIGYDDAWHLRLNPKFSDVFGDDYIRWPIGVRYNFNTLLEGQFDLGVYTGNPFDSGDGAGFYDIEPGFKYTVRRLHETKWDMAVGLRSSIPIADPPLEVTDGFARYIPYVTFSREMKTDPRLLGYLNLRYELVANTPFTANPVIPEPRDRVFVVPGVIYYPGGHFRYGLELEYRTNALALSGHAKRPADLVGPLTPEQTRAYETTHELIALPSVTWFPSRETRAGFRIPGNWDVGVRLELPIAEQTGEDFAVSVRFRWYYNYRHFLARDLPQLFRRDED